MQLEIRLLGRFSIRRYGEEVPPQAFRGRLVRRLIRILVTRRGEFVSRDFLFEALWAARTPADPASNLNVMVNRARRELGRSLILTGPGGYSFADDESCVVDAELFLAGVECGRSGLAGGKPAAALKDFLQALEHWSGEPLPEDSYEDWAQEYRNKLWRAYSQALEGAAEAALAVRDPGQAAALAEQAVRREPLREPAHLLLVRALAASGDTAAALARFQDLRRGLADELGLDPSTEALQLETRILRGERSRTAVRHSLTTFAPATLEPLRFVGRQQEIERVRAWVTGPILGTVVVAGSPGAGKSRLLSEAAAQSNLPVIGVRAFHAERDQAWTLSRSLLRQVLDLDPNLAASLSGRLAQALAEIVPEVEELRPVEATVMDPESARALGLEGAIRIVERFASQGAVLLVDDLQWADATSVALLGLIRRRLSQLAMVVAYRPEEVHGRTAVAGFLQELSAMDAHCEEVALGPLPADAIRELLDDEAVAQAIIEETDLTPFAVAEVIRSLAEKAAIDAVSEGRWQGRRDEAGELAREAARAGKRRGVQVRIGRQSPERKQILSVLSLVGREIPARIICALTAAEQPKLLDDLDTLAQAGLVRLGDEGWAPAHDLIADIIAEGLDRAYRGRLHALLAEVLQKEGIDPAEAARHLARAGDSHAAAQAFAEAARQRLERFANGEAELLADVGLRLATQPALRSELYGIRAEGRARKGDVSGAQDDLRAALVDKRTGPQRARILTRLAMVTSGSEDYARASELIELALLEAGADEAARAHALAVAAILDVNTGRPERSRLRSDEALALFEKLGDAHGIAEILDNRAMYTLFEGRGREAVIMLGQVARLFRDAGDLLRVGTPLAIRGFALALMGRAEEGLQDIDEALDVARTTGQPETAMFLWTRSEALTVLGRLNEAIETAEAAREISCRLGHREFMAGSLAGLGFAYQLAGDLERAEACYRDTIEEAVNAPIVSWIARDRLASLLVSRGDIASAEGEAAVVLKEGLPSFQHEARLVMAEIAFIRCEPEAESIGRKALALAEATGYIASPTFERVRVLVEGADERRHRRG